MKTGKARVAVIGTGWWSTYTHIPALQAHPEAELVALCDSNPERLQAAASAYQVKRMHSDLQVMLEQETLDGVVIATSHASHYPIARYCLEHDLHVMLEKPMTLYASEARVLVGLAGQHRRELIAGYPYHYTAHVLRAREVIRSGSLGRVQYVNCVFTSHIIELLAGRDGSEQPSSAYPVHGPGDVYSQPHLSGGGEGHLQVTHSAGLMFFVTGLRARRVHALMNNHGLPLDLVDAMTVEFEGGALGTVGGCGNTAGTESKLDLLIHCEHGVIDMDMIAGTTIIRGQNHPRESFGPEPDNYPRTATAHNLVDVILGRAENGSPGWVGWRTVELLDAAYRSAQADGQGVLIEDLYP
jgi:predicted dehydrogenase